MIDLKKAVETIEKYLRVHTHPVALKFFDDVKDIPGDVRRPSIFGVKMAFCQIITVAHRILLFE